MSVASDTPRKGDIIAGKYQVEELLGQGGMGLVVAATHVNLRQRVAIKFLLPAAARLPGASERFLREARAAGAIRSEHVARVLDVATSENGAPYMVMEYLAGRDFAKLLKQRGPLPTAEVVDLVLQAGEAIAEAHSLQILHRDLKPGNLFLTARADGSPLVKVLDFGLSKMIEEDVVDGGLTATSVVVGSPQYMSPEQFRNLKYVDRRTDIWALGVILYELLTGRRPFDGATATAIAASVAADVPTPPSLQRSSIPPGLDTMILKCLEKDVSRRVPDMAALAQGLLPFGSAASALSAARIVKVIRGAEDTVEALGSLDAMTVPRFHGQSPGNVLVDRRNALGGYGGSGTVPLPPSNPVEKNDVPLGIEPPKRSEPSRERFPVPSGPVVPPQPQRVGSAPLSGIAIAAGSVVITMVIVGIVALLFRDGKGASSESAKTIASVMEVSSQPGFTSATSPSVPASAVLKNPGPRVSVDLSKSMFRAGEDVSLRIASSTGAYIWVFAVASDGSNALLLPRSKEKTFHLAPGSSIYFPTESDRKAGLRLTAALPPGQQSTRERIVALSAQSQSDLDQLAGLRAPATFSSKDLKDRIAQASGLPETYGVAESTYEIEAAR